MRHAAVRRLACLGILAVLGAIGAARAASFTKTLDRRFPSNYCPIDNDDYDLTFTAASDRVKIKVRGPNQNGTGSFLKQGLDNMVVVAKSVFDANRILNSGYTACYLTPPGPANYQGYNWAAAGTNENLFDQFDTNAAAWDLTNYGWWDNLSDNCCGPKSPANKTDLSGGALALGRDTDGAVTVGTDITVTGLAPGTLYVITGWWATQDLNTLTFTIDTDPCVDVDGDGVKDCAGDCNDRDPKIKPGAAEVCDGRDNDCDGIVDDNAACVRVCSTPAKIGSDQRITNAQFLSEHPALVWNGIDYGMFWKDSRNGDQEIFFTHVNPAGTKVGGDISLTGNCFDCVDPRAVWNGTEYGVVWSQSGAISFRRFDRNGTGIGTVVSLIDPAGSSADEPDVAWNGSEYGVVWDQFISAQEIRFIRVDALGQPASAYLKITDGSPFTGNTRPRIAWSGSQYGVVWSGNSSGQPEINFVRVDPRQGVFLPALGVTTHGSGALAPSIVWAGSLWGVAWEDERTFTEVYFQRINPNGTKNGTELRVTNAAGVSNDPSLAWTGSEYGVSWMDDRTGNSEIWFGRITSAGAKVGTDLQLTNDVNQSQQPSLAFGGSKYAAAWNDDRFSGDQEILFLRLGCNCVDGDLDGQTSCVDCDDAHATVFGGAAQICDGLNNDCNEVHWPLLTGTNEADGDGDTFSVCGGDCNDANGAIWGTPGEAQALTATKGLPGNVNLSWSPPASLGGTSVLYDTLRSNVPSNFTSSAACVESNDGANTFAVDTVASAVGELRFYLVRAENACPAGQGILGTNSAGTPTPGRACP